MYTKAEFTEMYTSQWNRGFKAGIEANQETMRSALGIGDVIDKAVEQVHRSIEINR